MADPVRLVCSVCYKVSSHKSNPTLTPESKAISDGKTKTCGVCRQEWVPIRITEEIGGQGRLVIIRSRPKNVNPAVKYQLCNRKEQCTKRDECSFAHSNVELAAWNREQEKMPRVPPRLHAGQQFMLCKYMGPGRSCPYGLRCAYAHSDEELKEWNRLVSDQHMAARHGGSYAGPPGGVPPPIRPRPHNFPPPTRYRMCWHVDNGRMCGFGDNCHFAHSPSELDAWNRQAAVAKGGARFHYPRGDPPPFQRPPFAAPYAASHPPPPPHAGPNFHPYPQHPQGFVEQRRPRFEPSALDKFEDEAPTQAAAGDDNELPRKCETGSQTPEFAKNLRDRVLTDGNSTSFLETKNGVSIMELTRLGFNLKRRELAPLEWVFSISTTSPQHFKSVVLLDQLMTDYSIEGVWLHPQGGVKFGHTNPDMGVVVSEQVTEWNIIPGEKAQVKIHLNPRAGILSQVVIFDFEEFYMVQGLMVHYLGEKEIKLLESIDKRPKPAKKDLYWEQHHEKVPYPLKHDEGGMKFPDYPLPEKVETLLEQGKYNNMESKITKKNFIFECYVDHVGKDTVVLKITEKAAQACKESMNRCSIRFILGNVSMRAMHYAVDQLDLEVLYGTQSATPAASPAGIKRCLDDLAKLELYDKQKNAIRGMLEPLYQKVPSLVLGPFGCGKTRTLSECIKLLTLYVPEARILVCAHSNSAADLYVENMSTEWRRRGLQKAPLFRLYFTGRKLSTISPIVREYCKIMKDWPVIPSLDELKQYKVVVSTLMTARTLSLMEMNKGWFTHIFIDEAAQALEAECLIPLCLANSKTKVILAGDHMQLNSPVYSTTARKYGLQQSLLERLFDSDMYKKDSPLSQYCKVQLTENYRSCEKIVGLLSKLFYNNELICKTMFDPLANLPSISFVGVDGSESQDEGSPSYYNVEEAVEVARQVNRLVEKDIRPGEVCVLSFYTGQIQHIRQVLRSDHLPEVVVRRVDDVQGNEFRALIVSTVRTCADVPISEEKIDFLSNPKLFVTALTRAREVLIVVGDPVTLCSVGLNQRYWVEYVLQCEMMRSFIYQKPVVFVQQVRARVAIKQLLAKNSKKLPPSSSAPQNMATSAPQATPPAPPTSDLYWEQRHEKVPYPLKHEGGMKFPDYPLPEKGETLLEQGNMESKITKENYKKRMHNLLYLEEYQQRKDMSRYDLCNIEVTLQEQWEDMQKGVVYAPSGFSYIVLTIDEVLYEGGRSIKPSDRAYLHPVLKNFIFECYVDHVDKDTVVLKITEKAAQACKESMNRCSIRFILGNVSMRAMHYAVDQLDLEVLYGTQSATPAASPAGIKRCLDDLAKLELYDKQKNAIRGMLEPLYQKVPSLVLGPFGCGKTRTLSECIKLLTLFVPEARILVCAHSNSAADLYVENMSTEWRRRGLQKAPLFRLYFTGRKLNTISPIVREYCKIMKDWPVIPSLDELKEYKVVVSTLMTAGILSLMEMSKGWFTHIFIDEAAQALEAECLIPLCLANSKTKVILAGDHMQLDPPVYSPTARKYGLQQSLLERLFDSDMYKKDSPLSQYCKVQLTENYRSCEKIVGLLSKFFYNNELICKTTFDLPANLPSISFVGVDGSESQDEGSPSYYNVEEAVEVARQVNCLVEKGIRPGEVCVLSFYTGQIQHIRQVLPSDCLSEVVVCRVDDVQGNEFRALIVSTVRTCVYVPIPEEEIDFLSNPKLFVTALTRAREVLIVVGDPVTLWSVGLNQRYWFEYVRQCATMESFVCQKPDVFLARLATNKATTTPSTEMAPPPQQYTAVGNPSYPTPVAPSVATGLPVAPAPSLATGIPAPVYSSGTYFSMSQDTRGLTQEPFSRDKIAVLNSYEHYLFSGAQEPYPPQQQPYPPQQQLYQPQQEPYPPQQQPYPPQQQPYPPQQQQYPHQQQPYPPQQQPYPLQQEPYPPQQEPYPHQQKPYQHQQQPYPHQQQPYPPQQQPYPLQQEPYPPQQEPYPHQQKPYQHQQQPYPPQQQPYPPQQQPYPPQQQQYPHQQQSYPPQQQPYPHQQQPYPPQQPGYPHQQSGYPPQQPGYPPIAFPSVSLSFPSQQQSGAFPPQQQTGGFPPGFPPCTWCTPRSLF